MGVTKFQGATNPWIILNQHMLLVCPLKTGACGINLVHKGKLQVL